MRRLPLALALAIALAVAASPVLASGTVHQATNGTTDPYATCTAGSAGINYPRSNAEPFGSINRSNPSNIVTAVQQDRWSNGGAHGLAAGVSTTGGSSWRVVPLPFSACASHPPAHLQYQRASDPRISFGPRAPANPSRATAYSDSISFHHTP